MHALFLPGREMATPQTANDDRVDIAFTPLNAAAVEKICASLLNTEHVPPIRVLDLTDNNLGPELTERIAAALESSCVEEVVFRFNNVGKNGCDALSSTVNVSTRLHLLDLRGNHLTLPDLAKLLKSVSMSTSLTQLGLGGNDLGPDGMAALASALEHNSFITHVDLWSNNIGPTGAPHIARVLQSEHCQLRILDLWGNQLGTKGCELVADALRRNSSLKRISLGNNGCGDGACAAIAAAMQKNRTLEDLDLRSNSILPAGIQVLAAPLAEHPTLLRLALSANPIGAEGADCICKALLSGSGRLTSLDLWSCRLTSKGAERMAGLIASHSTLAELNLACNDIDDVGAESLAQGLRCQKSQVLKILDLVNNRIGVAGATQLLEALLLNPSLTSLSLHGNDINRVTQKRVDEMLASRTACTENDSGKTSFVPPSRSANVHLPFE